MYGSELIVMIVAIFSLSLSGGAPSVNIISVNIFWRFILGIGKARHLTSSDSF
jgi:hypothetical protein